MTDITNSTQSESEENHSFNITLLSEDGKLASKHIYPKERLSSTNLYFGALAPLEKARSPVLPTAVTTNT
ncbi:hypothetical protein OHC33_005734 [Knufia fluminis]|uniref:Uncharacterized protein n=1 Tax=Knufia fluminis TaxID=191047 RepID=A0AAN8I7F2_9EURO|nr:hypothetical protein OHC33_005734 [Knufia fluminis]